MCLVAMEACGGAHHWEREMERVGHAVRLIAPRYVKPFIKRQKNDAADAEAIVEAALRPTMRSAAGTSNNRRAAPAREPISRRPYQAGRRRRSCRRMSPVKPRTSSCDQAPMASRSRERPARSAASGGPIGRSSA